MNLKSGTEQFLDAAESNARRKFRFRQELGVLVECSGSAASSRAFDDLVFSAKFISGALEILRRPGIDPEQTGKLSGEFSAALRRVPELITSIVRSCSPDRLQLFTDRLLALDDRGMETLMKFVGELACLKNYLLDGGTVPRE